MTELQEAKNLLSEARTALIGQADAKKVVEKYAFFQKRNPSLKNLSKLFRLFYRNSNGLKNFTLKIIINSLSDFIQKYTEKKQSQESFNPEKKLYTAIPEHNSIEILYSIPNSSKKQHPFFSKRIKKLLRIAWIFLKKIYKIFGIIATICTISGLSIFGIISYLNNESKNSNSENLTALNTNKNDYQQVTKSVIDTIISSKNQSDAAKNKELKLDNNAYIDTLKTNEVIKTDSQSIDSTFFFDVPIIEKSFVIEAKNLLEIANTINPEKDKSVGPLEGLINRFNNLARKTKLDYIKNYDYYYDKDGAFGKIAPAGIAKLEEIKFLLNIYIKFSNIPFLKKQNKKLYYDVPSDSYRIKKLNLIIARNLLELANKVEPEKDKSVGILAALINRYNAFAHNTRKDSVKNYDPYNDKDGAFGKIAPAGIAKLVEIKSILQIFIETTK